MAAPEDSFIPRKDYELATRVDRGLVPGGSDARVVIAASGGGDSMALVHLLARAAGIAGSSSSAHRFVVCHVDHAQRDGAHEERALVSQAASECGFAFVARTASLERGASEAAMREARYAILREVAQAHGNARIATAHTKDDQIETMLLHLFRGSGRNGLGGMRASSGTVDRPLLGTSRAELRAFLERNAIEWFDDPSNASPSFARNRVRSEVLGAVRSALGPEALEHLPAMAASMALEEDYLDAQARRFAAVALVEGGTAVDPAALEEAPEALRPRVLRIWLERVTGRMPTRAQLAELESLVAGGTLAAHHRLAGIEVAIIDGRLRRRAQGAECAEPGFMYNVTAVAGTRYVGPQGAWEIEVAGEPPPAEEARGGAAAWRSETLVLAAKCLKPKAIIRRAEPGDVIRCDRHSRVRVHDMMTQHRVPRALVPSWPVLVGGDEVLWVPGLAVAHGVRAAHEEDEGRVRLRWEALHT